MFKKSLGKKLIAFVLAGCMVLPAAGYLSGTDIREWFRATEVKAENPAGSNVPIKVVSTVDANGYVQYTYYEAFDLNGNGVIESNPDPSLDETLVDISKNPKSPYYTRYRKTQYFVTGNSAPAGRPSNAPSNAGLTKRRYDASGNIISSLKSNPTADLGTEGNPCVVLEIVPDALSTSMSWYIRGQEPFNQTYANMMIPDRIGFNGSYFASINSHHHVISEKVNGTDSGIYYSSNSFPKEILGFGYRDQELAQAPEIENYTFVDWFFSTDENFTDSTYNNAEKVFGGYGSIYNTVKTYLNNNPGKKLHLYAKWTYKTYDGDTADGNVVYTGETTDTSNTSDSQVFEVDHPINIRLNNGNNPFVITVPGIVFHYCLPKDNNVTALDGNTYAGVLVDVDGDGKIGEVEPEDMDSDGDGLKGEKEIVSVAPKAPISFQEDYDFSGDTVIDFFNSYAANFAYLEDRSRIDVLQNLCYPSLMGNTDWNFFSTGCGYTQVVTISASELKDAVASGQTALYESVLDNADLVYLIYQQYGATMLSDVKAIAEKYSAKAEAYKSLLREDVIKGIENTAVPTPDNLVSNVEWKNLAACDIEGFAALRLFKNMAAQNSLNKKIPVLADARIKSGDGQISNLNKLWLLGLINEDVSVTYAELGSKIEVKNKADYFGVPNPSQYSYTCSDNLMVLKRDDAHEYYDWKPVSVLWPKDYTNDTGKFSSSNAEHNQMKVEKWRDDAILTDTPHKALSASFMTYNGDNTVMSNFIHGDSYYTSNEYTDVGFEYLREEGVINTSKSGITTALALHSLLFSGGGRTDYIQVDNSSNTYAVGANTVYIVNEFTGIGSTKLLYHLETNFGTDYYIEYYKVPGFLTSPAATIAAHGAVKLKLSGGDPTDTAGLRTYGRIDGTNDLNMSDIKSIEPFTYRPSGAAADVVISETVKLTNEGPTPDKRLVGVLLNSTAVDSTHVDKYVIVARHSDKSFITYAYVEVSISNSPFNLD